MKEVKKISVIENDVKSVIYVIPPFRENIFESTEHLLNFSFLRSWSIWKYFNNLWFSFKTISFQLFPERITLKLYWCDNLNINNKAMIKLVYFFLISSILLLYHILRFNLSFLQWSKSYRDWIWLFFYFVCIHAGLFFIILRERLKLRICIIKKQKFGIKNLCKN